MPLSTTIIVAMLAGGMSLIIGWLDRRDTRNRPLALFLLTVAGALLSAHPHIIPNQLIATIISETLIVFSIFLLFEWGRRIGQTVDGRRRIAAEILLRIGQGFVVVYWILLIIYVAVEPDMATSDAKGFFTVNVYEWAVFAPVLGSSLLLALIAFGLMLTMRMDRAERMRLHVLWLAAPFLLGGMILQESWVPYSVTIGLLILLAASIQYLLMQSQRGQFLSQFLSPQVTQVVRERGMHEIDSRQKTILSVVVCDLRGFTAYARQEDSDEVVSLLEKFYAAVGEAAAAYNGTIKDHAGDGVLILVGAPLPVKDFANQAIQLGCAIMAHGQAVLADAGLSKRVGLGVGIATGTVTAGTIRGAGHKAYVAVGNPVNLAARLCDVADNGDILVDTRTLEARQEFSQPAEHAIQNMQPQSFKGFSVPVSYCRIRG